MSDIDALFAGQMKAGDNQLKNISALINEEDDVNKSLETQEAIISQLKERRTELRTKLIPSAMLEAGMREFVTEDGVKATITFATDGALGSARTPEEWAERERKLDVIEAHGGGEIIKMAVTVEFPKDMFGDAELLRKGIEDQLREAGMLERGVGVTKQRSVHHQTLGSWIRSKMEADKAEDQLPASMLEDIGIWYGEIAKIKRPKK
jgi:hypothetical protein